MQEFGALLECQTGGAISSLIYGMARCLVTQQLDMYAVIHSILKKVYNISKISY